MPPDSQGYTFMDVSLHHEPLCTSISNTVTLPDVIRPQIHRAASTNTEFGTSAKHIDHASLTKSLPCNSGGPTIPEPDLHVHHHVQHEPHEDHLQDYRTVRAQLVARGQQWTGVAEDDLRRLMELTDEQHSDIPEGSETRAPNAAGSAAFLASSARSTLSCSSTSTSSKIDNPTRKPLPDCEIEQISPPNGWFASSRNPKGEIEVTPKEPPIPSYATSHRQFDYAVSMGWNIAMFLVCGDWHEPAEPIIGPIYVPECMREPGLAPGSSHLGADDHIIKVPEFLTKGAEVFYDRTTNLFREADWDYDSDEDEDPGLREELFDMDQPRVMSSSGLTNHSEHTDPSAEVPRQAESTATLKTSSTPPDLPGGGGIEPTSHPKSITSLGSTPSGHASANPSKPRIAKIGSF